MRRTSACSRGRHPRLPRRERPRADLVRGHARERRSRGAARARRVRRGGASPHPRSGPGATVRRRDRLVRRPQDGRLEEGLLVAVRRRARGERGDESREERLRDRDEPIREPGTVTSLLPFSTARTTARATSSDSITNRRSIPLRSFARCGKPSVSTKPGITVWTWMPVRAEERSGRAWRTRAARASPLHTLPPARTRPSLRPRRC